MCEPVTATQAVVAISAASAAVQYQTNKQAAKNQYAAQNRQNELARANALNRYATEQLRIRQVVNANRNKSFEAAKKADKARAAFLVGAGERGLGIGGSTELLLADYYRTEGNYNAALQKNLQINYSQYLRNMEAIKFGAEAQSTYVQPPNNALLFASSALNVANTYYGLEAAKENAGLLSNTQKQRSRDSIFGAEQVDV